MNNLQYYGDVNLIHGGSFASRDSEGYYIMKFGHDDSDDRMQPNILHVERNYVYLEDVDLNVLAEFSGMTVDEYSKLPEYIHAIDYVNYYGGYDYYWTVVLPYEEDPYFFNDDNQTILEAVQEEGIGMNGILVIPEWEDVIRN